MSPGAESSVSVRRLLHGRHGRHGGLALLVAGLVLAMMPSCRARFQDEGGQADGSGADTLQVSAALQDASNRQMAALQTEWQRELAKTLEARKASGRLADMAHFKKHYGIFIGDTASCFAPSRALGSVRLGIENDEQRAQLLSNLRSVLDFALGFYEAMGQRENALFGSIELCGVGMLAKHLPTENRSKRPLELMGRRLMVWNDKFLGGYALVRTDALMRAWSHGDIEAALPSGSVRGVFEKAWPALNPIGPLRIAIRQHLQSERTKATADLARIAQEPTWTSGQPAPGVWLGAMTSNAVPVFRQKAQNHLAVSGLSSVRAQQVLRVTSSCLADPRTADELEELGVCASLMRTARVTGDQSNFSLLVGVMNFHNIQVGAGVCTGDGARMLVPPPNNDVELKQRCVGLLVSVCTVDNVQVLAQLSLVPKALPTLCAARALQETAPAQQPFSVEL